MLLACFGVCADEKPVWTARCEPTALRVPGKGGRHDTSTSYAGCWCASQGVCSVQRLGCV